MEGTVAESENLRQRSSQNFSYDGKFARSGSPDGIELHHSEPQPAPEKPISISNMCWLVVAVLTFYVTDFYTMVRYDVKVNRFWLNIGLFCISVNVTIAVFLIGWLTFIKKVSTDDWEKLYPMAIPVASGCFCFGSIFCIIGLWPLWGFLTPFILGILFMGFVVIVMLIPPYSYRKCPEVSKSQKNL